MSSKQVDDNDDKAAHRAVQQQQQHEQQSLQQQHPATSAFAEPPFVIPAQYYTRPHTRNARNWSYPLDSHTMPGTHHHDVHVRAGGTPDNTPCPPEAPPEPSPFKHLSKRLSFDLLDADAAAQRAARIERARLADSDLWHAVEPHTSLQRTLHVLSETFLIFRLALTLWSHLGLGMLVVGWLYCKVLFLFPKCNTQTNTTRVAMVTPPCSAHCLCHPAHAWLCTNGCILLYVEPGFALHTLRHLPPQPP